MSIHNKYIKYYSRWPFLWVLLGTNMKACVLYLGLFFTGIGTVNATETNPFKLPFGQKFPIEATVESTLNLPIVLGSFMVPMPRESGLLMFYDYKLVYTKDKGHIMSVQAKRAYYTMKDCMADLRVATEVIESNVSPKAKVNSGHYESDEFQYFVGCGVGELSRFYELNFSIFHKPTQIEIDAR